MRRWGAPRLPGGALRLRVRAIRIGALLPVLFALWLLTGCPDDSDRPPMILDPDGDVPQPPPDDIDSDGDGLLDFEDQDDDNEGH